MDTGTPSGQAALFDTSSEPASPVPVTDGPEVRPARRGSSGSSKSSAVPSLENRAYAIRLAIHAYWVGLLVSIAAALIVILTAIDVQSGRIPDTEGHGWAFSTLFGPDFGSGLNQQGLTVLTTEGELTAEGLTTLERLLGVHLVIDSIFGGIHRTALAHGADGGQGFVANGGLRRGGLAARRGSAREPVHLPRVLRRLVYLACADLHGGEVVSGDHRGGDRGAQPDRSTAER